MAVAAAEARTEVDGRYRAFLYSERDADVHPRLNEDVSSEAGLSVLSIHAEVGDRVASGQLLATLEDEEARLELGAAQPEADYARANYERMRELFEREVITPSEHEEALYAKQRADAHLARARFEVARTQIRAPFAGVVSKRYVRLGQMVDASTPLFRVTQTAPLRARLLVPEERASAFRPGAPVRLEGLEGQTAAGEVLLVSPTVDPASGTREVIVRVSDTGGLAPGSAVFVAPAATAEAEIR